jgi:iron complex transport system permease protein
MTMRAHLLPYLWTTLALSAALLLSAAIGAVAIPPLDTLRILLSQLPFLHIAPTWPNMYATILFDIRLPRTILIALTGAALSGSGAAYQGLFRNPLADPYLIGIASGAGLGAVIAMALQWPSTLLGFATIPAAAFVSALLTAAIVYYLARVGRTTPVTTLILAGVAVGSFATALTTFLMLQSQSELRRAIVWMLGGFALGGWEPVVAVLPYIALGLIVLIALGRQLNVLQFGDDQAQQLGLNVERAKLVLITAASLAAAAAVAFSGIIGFVGLAVPHIVRLLWGTDYRRLIPLSIISGATGLLLADIAARTVIAPQELPVGIVTALIGAPFFLWLLRRAKQQTFW